MRDFELVTEIAESIVEALADADRVGIDLTRAVRLVRSAQAEAVRIMRCDVIRRVLTERAVVGDGFVSTDDLLAAVVAAGLRVNKSQLTVLSHKMVRAGAVVVEKRQQPVGGPRAFWRLK